MGMAVSNNGASTNSYYSPVPAPFLAHKHARFVEIAPTSEPTIMVGAEFDALSPTSEPTEFKDRMGSFMVAEPTSEPTEFKDRMGAFMVSEPTSEPTEYREAGESMKLADTDGSPTYEPTIFDADKIPAVGEPTNEPTIFHAGEVPDVGGDDEGDDHEPRPTCENSADCAGGFCNFDEGSHGYCELCSDFDSAEQCHHDGLPEKGADECSDVCFDEDGSRRAVPTAEPTVLHLHSSEPTVYGQTGEPTVFGQSGEPTVAGQSGEPTVFGQSGEPTVFSQSSEPTVFTGVDTNEPTIFHHDTLEGHEPTNEPTVFFKESEPAVPATDSPTPSPSIPPHLHTWSPTGSGSFAPTSDPTIFPTPEPTPAI